MQRWRVISNNETLIYIIDTNWVRSFGWSIHLHYNKTCVLFMCQRCYRFKCHRRERWAAATASSCWASSSQFRGLSSSSPLSIPSLYCVPSSSLLLLLLLLTNFMYLIEGTLCDRDSRILLFYTLVLMNTSSTGRDCKSFWMDIFRWQSNVELSPPSLDYSLTQEVIKRKWNSLHQYEHYGSKTTSEILPSSQMMIPEALTVQVVHGLAIENQEAQFLLLVFLISVWRLI